MGKFLPVVLAVLAAAPLSAQVVRGGHAVLTVDASFPAVYLGTPLTAARAASRDSAYVRQTRPEKWPWGTGPIPDCPPPGWEGPWCFYTYPRKWYPVNVHPALKNIIGDVPLYLVTTHDTTKRAFPGHRLVAMRQGRFFELPRDLNQLLNAAKPDMAALELLTWTRAFTLVALACSPSTGFGLHFPRDGDFVEVSAGLGRRQGAIFAGKLPLFPQATIQRVEIDTFRYYRLTKNADGSVDTGYAIWLEVAVRSLVAGEELDVRYKARPVLTGSGRMLFYPCDMEGAGYIETFIGHPGSSGSRSALDDTPAELADAFVVPRHSRPD